MAAILPLLALETSAGVEQLDRPPRPWLRRLTSSLAWVLAGAAEVGVFRSQGIHFNSLLAQSLFHFAYGQLPPSVSGSLTRYELSGQLRVSYRRTHLAKPASLNDSWKPPSIARAQ
jgi:hypothetical protein